MVAHTESLVYNLRTDGWKDGLQCHVSREMPFFPAMLGKKSIASHIIYSYGTGCMVSGAEFILQSGTISMITDLL
jgi:hypothetical protein